jgi:hypothetical protein
LSWCLFLARFQENSLPLGKYKFKKMRNSFLYFLSKIQQLSDKKCAYISAFLNVMEVNNSLVIWQTIECEAISRNEPQK